VIRVWWMVTALACAYSLGRAPASVPSVSLGEVSAPTAEPGLKEAIERSVADAAARRTRVGEGPALRVTVLSATARTAAADGVLAEASLSLRFQLDGGGGVELTGRRGFPSGADPEAASAARAEAFAALADELAAEAVLRLLSAPSGGAP